MKEVKEDLNKSRDTLRSWVGRLNIVKTSIIFKLIYRSNAIPFKNLAKVFMDINECFLRFIKACKGIRTAETILKRKKTVARIIYPNSRFIVNIIFKTLHI